jgi:phosphoribosylformylglycinamidine (FGAM) synthase-like enzyme
VAEACIAGSVGAAVEADDLFAEGDGRVVVTAREQDVEALRELAGDLPLRRFGTVGGATILVGAAEVSLAEAAALHEAGIFNAVGA